MSDIQPEPRPQADDATDLIVTALSLVRNWQFLTDNPRVVLTPRQSEELQAERAQWFEQANRWSKNKPGYEVPYE